MTYPPHLSFAPVSKVVLVGTAACPRDTINLPPLPHVERNIRKLARIFINKDIIGLPLNSIVSILNCEEASALLTEMATAALQATDTLIVYYAGHGIYGDNQSPLYLTAKNTVAKNRFPFTIDTQLNVEVLSS